MSLTNTVALRQRATGPSSVCEGSDVTLQCVIVLINNNTTTVQPTVWTMPPDIIPAPFNFTNHKLIFNSTTTGLTDLVITNVILENDNTVYNCSTIGTTITSSVVLNVTGITCTHVNIAM